MRVRTALLAVLLLAPAAEAGSERGRDLATALADAAAGPGAPFLLGSVGVVVLVGAAVLVTSTVRRRPGSPEDPLLAARRRRRVPDGYDAGVRDARDLRFQAPGDVVTTLASVALATASVRHEGATLVVELPTTATSRAAPRARRPACLWETGFLEEGLRRFAEGRLRVREVACRATGAPHCRFVVEGRIGTRGERL